MLGVPATKNAYARRRLAQKHGMCGAANKDGSPCRSVAGQGTNHYGKGRCYRHEGDRGTLATVRAIAEDMATPIPTTPTQAIAGILNLSAGQLTFVTVKVGELKEDQLMNDKGYPHPWIVLQQKLMDRISSYAATATAMGLDERLARLAEVQTKMVSKLLDAVMDELDLTAEQRKQVGPAIRKHLPTLEGTAKEMP